MYLRLIILISLFAQNSFSLNPVGTVFGPKEFVKNKKKIIYEESFKVKDKNQNFLMIAESDKKNVKAYINLNGKRFCSVRDITHGNFAKPLKLKNGENNFKLGIYGRKEGNIKLTVIDTYFLQL